MADFSNYKKIDFATIKEYVQEEQPTYKATLKQMVIDGKSFLAIKKAFYEAFFPQYIPQKKEADKPSMKDMLKDW